MTFAFNFDKSGIHMNCMDNPYGASHMLLFFFKNIVPQLPDKADNSISIA